MKNIVLLALLFPIISNCQPKISVGNIPKLYDRLVYTDCSMNGSFSKIDSGQNVVWDISGFIPNNADTTSSDFVKIPSSYVSSFSGANLSEQVVRFSSQYYAMYSVSNGQYNYWGQMMDFPQIQDIFSDSKIIIKYPFEYSNSFIDNYKYDYSSSGNAGITQGNVLVRAAGYGMLKLPNSVNHNSALLVITNDYYQNNVGAKFKSIIYNWYSPECIGSVAQITLGYHYSGNQWIQDPPFMSYQQKPLKSTSSNVAKLKIENFISIYPNPVSNLIKINYPNNETYRVDILNSLGEAIFVPTFIESHSIQLDISSLSNGFYSLQLIDSEGVHIQKCFIK